MREGFRGGNDEGKNKSAHCVLELHLINCSNINVYANVN